MRVLVSGFILAAIMLAGVTGATAAISPYSLMPSTVDLSSFGFPASLLEPQAGLQPSAMSPQEVLNLTSSLLPDSSSSAAFNSFMPGISSTLSGFPALSGLGSFATPASYASQVPMMSALNFSGMQMPAGLQPSILNSYAGASPSTNNNYTEASNGKTVTVKKGDVIHVQLPSRIDQGYIWNATVTDGLNVTNMHMYPPEQVGQISNTGEVPLQAIQEFDVQAVDAGIQHFTADYKRPWADGPDDKTYSLTVIVV